MFLSPCRPGDRIILADDSNDDWWKVKSWQICRLFDPRFPLSWSKKCFSPLCDILHHSATWWFKTMMVTNSKLEIHKKKYINVHCFCKFIVLSVMQFTTNRWLTWYLVGSIEAFQNWIYRKCFNAPFHAITKWFAD